MTTNSQLEANKALVRRLFEALDRHDKDEVFEILHPDHRVEFPGNAESMDREGHWRLIESYHTAFNDMKHQPEFQLAEGDHVLTRGVTTGTHTGPLGGLEATGAKTAAQFMNITRIVDGKICGIFTLLDS